MSLLIGLAARLVGKKFAPFLAYGAVIALIVGLGWWWLDSYGDRRYAEGVKAESDRWIEASEKLEQQAEASATKADDAAVERLTEHVAEQAKEQEQIDEAVDEGSSPLDVLFGA